jgi:HAD superfamily hydrolase (TIGR01509 family)
MPQKNKTCSDCYSKTFLIDIGRVLLNFDFESSLIKLIPEDIDNPKERVQCILEKKDALESGLIAPKHYANWALKILGSHATIEQFYHAWQQIFTVNEAMWRCVHQLANQKHSLILISNINAIHCPWIFSAYPEFSYFKHKILSYQIGILKPEPAIYRYAIDHFKLDPKSTLYIDDMPQNIASGREAGFQCWQYDLNNHQAFENWLAQALTSQ